MVRHEPSQNLGKWMKEGHHASSPSTMSQECGLKHVALGGRDKPENGRVPRNELRRLARTT